MTIPNLKRIKIGSEQDLLSWFGRNPDHSDDVMIVTHAQSSTEKYVSVERVHDAITAYGWAPGRRYTLNGNLIGQVISRT